VDLLEKLTTWQIILVKNHDLKTVSGSFNGSSQSRRSCTHADHLTSSQNSLRRYLRSISDLRLNDHPFLERLHTRSHIWYPINDHDAVCATPNGTKHSPGFIPFDCVPVDEDPVGPKGNGNRFTFEPFHGAPIKSELHLFSFFKTPQNWMVLYSHI
jgi:hypothetical protein